MKCGRLFFVLAFLVSFNSNKAIKLEVIEPKEKLVNEGDTVKLRCGTIGANKYCTFRHFGSETRICRMQWKKVTICKFDKNIVQMQICKSVRQWTLSTVSRTQAKCSRGRRIFFYKKLL